MGYRSDIRCLIKKTDYNKMIREIKKRFGEDNNDYKFLFGENGKELIYKQRWDTREDKAVEYAYFGWNCIKWYTNIDSEYHKVEDFIENFVKKCEIHQFCRLGEEYGDWEEDYELRDSWVRPISITQRYDDDLD